MASSVLLELPSRKYWLQKLIDRICGGSPRGIKLKRLWEKNGKRCYYCKDIITLNQSSRDHRQPRSRGGSDDPRNICLACKECNSAKQDMTEQEYWELLREDRLKWGYHLKRPQTTRKGEHHVCRSRSHCN